MSLVDKLIGEDCCVRSKEAGVFVGVLEEKTGAECIVSNARRIWYWDGAASLSQLALEGVKKPENCKFPPPVEMVILPNCCEIIPMREEAIESINNVREWLES